MCNTKVQQFLSGFLLGVVMCIWVVSFFQQWQVVKFSTSSSGKYDNTKEVVGYSVVARLIGRLMKSNDDVSGIIRQDSNYSRLSLAVKNKIVVTCVVPLPGYISEYSQSEFDVLLKWADSCDHVVHVFIRPRQKRHAQKSVKEYKFRRNIFQNNHFSYYSGDLSELDQRSGRLRAQYKALKFAKIKYPDTGLFIITPSPSEFVKDFLESFADNMNDHFRISTSISEILTTNHTLNSDFIMSLNKFLLLGKRTVTSLIKQVTSNNCHFENSQSFREWTASCLSTLDFRSHFSKLNGSSETARHNL